MKAFDFFSDMSAAEARDAARAQLDSASPYCSCCASLAAHIEKHYLQGSVSVAADDDPQELLERLGRHAGRADDSGLTAGDLAAYIFARTGHASAARDREPPSAGATDEREAASEAAPITDTRREFDREVADREETEEHAAESLRRQLDEEKTDRDAESRRPPSPDEELRAPDESDRAAREQQEAVEEGAERGADVGDK